MKKQKTLAMMILFVIGVMCAAIPATATSTTHFNGTVNYYTYAVKGGDVLQDLDCPATAELEFLGGQAIQLELTENGECGGRTTVLEGKLAPGGQLKAWYPDPLFPGTAFKIEDLVKEHTGCTSLAGTFPVYHGSMDSHGLYARTIFNCHIPEYWEANDIFATPVDGPLHWQWTLDLIISP